MRTEDDQRPVRKNKNNQIYEILMEAGHNTVSAMEVRDKILKICREEAMHEELHEQIKNNVGPIFNYEINKYCKFCEEE